MNVARDFQRISNMVRGVAGDHRRVNGDRPKQLGIDRLDAHRAKFCCTPGPARSREHAEQLGETLCVEQPQWVKSMSLIRA